MTASFLPRRRSRQPQQAVRIDRTNPITQGLVFLGTVVDGAYVNLLTGQRGTPSATPFAISNSASGRSIHGSGSGQSVNFGPDLATADMAINPMTMFVYGTFDVAGGCLAARNDNNSINAGWYLKVDGAGSLAFLKEFASTNSMATSAASIATGAPASGAVVYDGVGSVVALASTFYINGVAVAAARNTDGSGVSGSDAARDLVIGGATFGVGQLAGDLNLIAMWKRQLSAVEIASLHDNRYQLFAPAPYIPLVAAPAVTTTGTATSSQAQTSAAAGAVTDTGAVSSQAQTSAATGTVSIAGTASSSQAQTSAATGTPSIAGTASSSQAQTSAAAGSAVTLWTVPHSGIDLTDYPFGPSPAAAWSFTGNQLVAGIGATTTGNSIVVLVGGYWRTDVAPAIAVTDDVGNTYLPASSLFVGAGSPAVNTRQWMQAFYCQSATGSSNLKPRFDVTEDPGATVFDLPARMHIAAFEVHSPLGVTPDVASYKQTTSNSTSITSNSFTTSDAGAVFALEINFFEDSVAASTTNFASPYTSLTRPGRDTSTGATDQTYGDAGYRITTGAAAQTATFTGDISNGRSIMAVGFISPPSSVTGTASSSQAQTSAAAGGSGWSGTASSSQAQTAAATGTVSTVSYNALTGVAGSGQVGAVAATHRAGITGAGATGAVGSFAKARAAALTGVAGTGRVGAVTRGATARALSGVAATGATGTLAVQRTRTLTGVAGSGNLATIFSVHARALAGVQATGAAGSVQPPSGVAGVSGAGAAGSVRPVRTLALTGVAGTGGVGSLGHTYSARVTGVQGLGAIASVVAARAVALAGAHATGAVGQIGVGQKFAGVGATASAGSVGQNRTIPLTGVSATTAAGRVGNSHPVESSSVFVSTPPHRVTVLNDPADVFIVSSAVSVVITSIGETE